MRLIKPWETNCTGYLIEHDGYINPDYKYEDKTNKELVEEQVSTNIKSGELPSIVEVYAVLQKYNTENRNGRVYTEDILRRENDKYQEAIKMRNSSGELNHPESSIIDGERISHIITKTWWDGKTLMGKLEVITSPGFHKSGIISCAGDIVANYLMKGMTIGISSRGVGSLKKENGKNMVQDDFELICWDIVTSPSTPGSWISTKQEELRPYMESVEEKKKPIINSLDKFLDKNEKESN